MAKVPPAGAFRERAKLAKRKRALSGKAGIGARHGFAINQCGQKVNAHSSEEASSKIGDQDKSLRQKPAALQQSHCGSLVEMMECERGEHDVVLPILSEEKNIALFEIDFWIVRAQVARDF